MNKPWQPPSPQDVINLWSKADQYLLKERRDYWMNASYFGGHQWVWWDHTRNIVQVLLMILMYLTPIFYPVTVMNSTMQRIIHWNPLTSYLDIFRWAFSNNATPTLFSWIYMSIWSIFALLLGTYVFKKYWPRTVAML